jgi:hypothetical protein
MPSTKLKTQKFFGSFFQKRTFLLNLSTFLTSALHFARNASWMTAP